MSQHQNASRALPSRTEDERKRLGVRVSSPVEAAPRVFPCSYVSTRFNDNWWQTFPSAINNLGEVSGTLSLGSNQKSKGFRREADGSFLPAPWFGPSIDVRLTGINDLGQYTGYYNDGNNSHAFLSTAEGDVFFDVPDATHTEPVAINRLGQVAGSYRYTTWFGQFVYHKGFIREPNGNITYLENAHYPTAMNNLGITVGYYMVNEGPTSTATGAMGFWHDSSGIHRFWIPYPGAQMYIPGLTPGPRLSINDKGQIAGTYYDGNLRAHGFVASIDTSGNTTFGNPIDFPGGDTALSGINDMGEVAGIRFNPGSVSPSGYGNVDVFVLSPQGIPSQITSDKLIGGGMVGINNRGQVLAFESGFPGPVHGLLFSLSCPIVNVP